MPPSWAVVFRLLFRLIAALARLAVRSGRSKDPEIIVVRHQLQVLGRQVDRPAIHDDDRTLLGASAAALPRRLRDGWIVTPETLSLAPQTRRPPLDQTPGRRLGRPPRLPTTRSSATPTAPSSGTANSSSGSSSATSTTTTVIDLTAPLNSGHPPAAGEPSPAPPTTITVLRTTRCDGLINEYEDAA